MKILSRVLFLLFILIGVLVAVSNSQSVQLALWPLPHLIVMPLYLLVILMLLLGVLAGLGLGWWASRHHRRRARDAARLGREVERLRQTAGQGAGGGRAAAPAASDGGPALRDRKAIERQSALVAPEMSSSGARGPFS